MAKKKKVNMQGVDACYNKKLNNDIHDIQELNLEYGWKILERMDSWINSSDNKVSVLIGIIGVVLTVFITSEYINCFGAFIKTRISDVINGKNTTSFVFLVCIGITFFLAGMSLYHIVKACIARIDEKKYKQDKLMTNSNLFFGTVVNTEYKEYFKDFVMQNGDARLNDILSQVYINACIAKQKHLHYNKAIKWLLITILFGFVVAVLASIVY